MNKLQFLAALRTRLMHLPSAECEERLNFYAEAIADRMEEGVGEEAAVSDLGTTDEIVAEILAEKASLMTEQELACIKRGGKGWRILLLSLGSPVWVSLLIIAFSVVFSLYVLLASVIISLWAAFAGCVAGVPFGIIAAFVPGIQGNPLTGVMLVAAALALAGISILFFFGCLYATRGFLRFSKWLVTDLKDKFVLWRKYR